MDDLFQEGGCWLASHLLPRMMALCLSESLSHHCFTSGGTLAWAWSMGLYPKKGLSTVMMYFVHGKRTDVSRLPLCSLIKNTKEGRARHVFFQMCTLKIYSTFLVVVDRVK